MWRKADDSKLKSSPEASPSPGSPAPQDSPNAAVAVRRGIKIKGEISGQGDFSLDGEFEGTIRLAGGTFTVGPTAQVNAEIEAREVIIRGEVIGTLKGCERVYIWSTGSLTGNMETRGVVIEDGAVLHSKVAVPRTAVSEVKAPQIPQSETEQPAEVSSPEAPPRAKRAAGAH